MLKYNDQEMMWSERDAVNEKLTDISIILLSKESNRNAYSCSKDIFISEIFLPVSKTSREGMIK